MNTIITIFYIVLALAAIFCVGVVWAIIDVRKKDRAYFKGTGKVLLILCALFLFSCNAAKHYQKIHGLSYGGTYTVATNKNGVTTFKEFPGYYNGFSDTLKEGNKATITTQINRVNEKIAKNVSRQ